MRSFNCSRALTSAEQSLISKWILGDCSLATFCSSAGVSTTTCVGMTDRRRKKPHCSSSLNSTFERQKRRKGTSRGKMSTLKVAVGGWALPALDHNMYQIREQALLTGEGPSCIFVGPLEKAEKARLEALYQQARDSYYSGSPLIVDDMFDRVEIRLRWHGSKLVLKYPRCSLKRFSAYADAEVDSSQMLALGSIWSILLASGLLAASFPPACAFNKACQKALNMNAHEGTSSTDAMMAMNGALAVGLGLVIGIPVAVAAARSLQGLWRGDLMALKGGCPNCGEEVYAFVNADVGEHRTECHVCEHPLVFRVNVERSKEHRGRVWGYGRVYLPIQSKDLTPKKGSKKGI